LSALIGSSFFGEPSLSVSLSPPHNFAI